MWAVVYDDGMSLITASERIARSLAEAERQRGRCVTVRRLDDVETHPGGVEKPARPPGRARGDGPVRPRGTDKPSVPDPSRAVGEADSVPEPEPIRPAERFARREPISEPESAPAPEPEPPESLEPARTPEQPEPVPASEPASEGQPPEPVPAAELSQVLGPTQAVEPTQAAELASVPELASEASPPELTREPEPAHAATPTRRRRLLLYALAAASIVVAAALVDHWGVLPRAGANTSSSPTQVGGPAHRAQLLPPLGRPPVMHFSNAVSATPRPRKHRRSRRVRRPSHQGRRTQPLDQPGRRHLRKARSPRWAGVPAAGRQPLPGEDDIDEDTSDCHQGHRRARFGPSAGERSDERAGARRGVDLDQRTRARRLRLRGEQPDAAGL